MNKIRLVNIARYIHANNIHLNLKLQASLQEVNIFEQVYLSLNYSLNLRIAKYYQFRSRRGKIKYGLKMFCISI